MPRGWTITAIRGWQCRKLATMSTGWWNGATSGDCGRADVGEADIKGAERAAGDEVLLCDVSDGVATITINRPDRRNSLSWDVLTEMRSALAFVRNEPEAKVVVITGAGDRAFSAGADLSGMAEGASFSELHDARGEIARLFLEMWQLGKPTVAKVRGYCLAGGFGLAMACDLVIASDDALFGTPEINVGLWPFQITVPMLRSMPPKVALDLMMTGRRVDATEALALGFVSRVVPEADLDATVDEVASTLASKSPALMRMGRDSFYRVLDQNADDALALLHPLLSLATQTEDCAEGITAFMEKRDPQWRGR